MKQGRGGSRRMKAPRGCENLKAQAVGEAFPTNHAAASNWEYAEGVETSREALLVGDRSWDRRRVSGRPEAQGSGGCLGIL